jgi:nicotinamide mononucleotide (NMN) deamidase PncC
VPAPFPAEFNRPRPVESPLEGSPLVADAHPTGIPVLPVDVSAPNPSDLSRAAAAVAEAITRRNQTVAVIEGATGGYLAHVLTTVPGSSKWFRAGIVAYTDYPKQLLLRVSTDTIESRGSISAETTIQMARLARRLFAVDWAVAITGYADDTSPAPSVRAPGAPGDVPAGCALVQGEIRDPVAGATIVAIAGTPGAGDESAEDADVSWQEHLVPAPDRDGYRRGASLVALEYLLEHLGADHHH